MNVDQFSTDFDTLLDSYRNTLKGNFGSVDSTAFTEYEKSVFLTKAQEDLIIDLYSGRNNMRLSFESVEEARRYLSVLVVESSEQISNPAKEVTVTLPDNLWFITYEECKLDDESLGCLNGSYASTVPVREDELYKTLENPFKNPSKKRILRLDVGDSVKLLSKYNISEYHFFYIRKPTPIILTNIGDLRISSKSSVSECELDDSLHYKILDRAVTLALASKGYFINNEA